MNKILLIVLSLFVSTSALGDGGVSEEEIKTAFIYHVINFVEWDDRQAEYNVCIPNDVVFESHVRDVLDGKTVNKRNIVVSDRTDNCHILVSDEVPATDHTLTIGPLDKGALMEFRIIDNKLKFAIDPEIIKKSKLKISSQLLKLAILEGRSQSSF